MTTVHTIAAQESLSAFAQDFASTLKPGDIVLLYGPMGVGKTTFSSLVGHALGAKENLVSPTFTIATEVLAENPQMIPKVVHMDLYRMSEESGWSAATKALVRDIFQRASEEGFLVMVEWAELLADTPQERVVQVRLAMGNEEQERIITISRS